MKPDPKVKSSCHGTALEIRKELQNAVNSFPLSVHGRSARLPDDPMTAHFVLFMRNDFKH